MTYNVSGLYNLSDPVSLMSWANTATGDVLFGGFLVALLVILVVRYSSSGVERALLAGSFVCFIISAVLRYAGLVSLLFVLGFLMLLVFTAIYVMVRGNDTI